MKRTVVLFTSMLLCAASSASSRDQRASLLPRLHAGQTLTYLIRYRSSKKVKTESRVAVPLAPTASETDAHGLLRIEVLHLQPAGDRFAMDARSQFLNDNFGGSAAKPAGDRSSSEAAPLSPEGNPVEFTISPEGLAEKVTGLDSLGPEQQLLWQEWLRRFAVAWAIPSSRAKIGDKWKIEQPEPAASPIDGLAWTRDSSYIRDEPCSPAELSSTGEATFSSGPTDNCAVLLTIAKLVQKSSPKEATPEDFKLHELKTMGTAKGSNELITYISLSTGLVVRATENATQQMDVVVAKADGSNGVRYSVDAKSDLEVLLLTEAQAPPQH
jgi:hypothetical protein